MDNKNEGKEKILDHENDNIKLDKKYQTLNDRINKLFNCYFDYYNKNNNSQSM
jgi:hypothetical protein